MVNKNWLIKNCRIKNTVMCLKMGEIDGIIIQNSNIFGYIAQKGNHCLYFGSNCSNIRTTNTCLGNTGGGAIHKNYSPDASDTKKGDVSRNQFYTDVFIHNAETCWCIAYISENTMCDSNFATHVNRVLVTGASTNCIISNCAVNQTRNDKGLYKGAPSPSFVTVWDAVRFWMQDSKVYHIGVPCTSMLTMDTYYCDMCLNYSNKRAYLGIDNDIANIMLKYTGCIVDNQYNDFSDYFTTSRTKSIKIEEYLENCLYIYSSANELFRLHCINHIHSGITIRNSYLVGSNYNKAPFRYVCKAVNCTCLSNEGCTLDKITKLPWVHFENVLFNKAFYRYGSKWGCVINVYKYEAATHNMEINEAANISNSYVSDCYKVLDDIRIPMSNLMRVEKTT